MVAVVVCGNWCLVMICCVDQRHGFATVTLAVRSTWYLVYSPAIIIMLEIISILDLALRRLG